MIHPLRPLPPIRKILAASLAAAVLTASLTACGRGTDATHDGPAAPSAAARPTDPPTTPAPSRGGTPVTLKERGVSFDLPKAWLTLSAGTLHLDASSPAVKEMAAKLGTPVPQFLQLLHKLDLVAVSESGGGGFVDNVNASLDPRPGVTAGDLRLMVVATGGRAGAAGVGGAQTAAGQIARLSYSLSLSARPGLVVRGVILAVPAEGGSLIITVSTRSAARSGDIADRISATLRKV